MKKINTLFRGITFLMCLFSVTMFGQNYSSSPGASLPDNSCNSAHQFSLAVSGVTAGNALTQVNVDIPHTWTSDLDITLIAPNGSSIDLASDNGSSGNGYLNVIFRDDSSNLMTTSFATFSGDYQPEEPLSNLGGQTDGTWILQVCDDAGGDTGTLNSWSLTFETPPPPSYCNSVPSTNDGAGITNLDLMASSFPLPDLTYHDLTGAPVTVFQGVDVNTQITFGTGYTYDTNIWIDFNDDYVFDASEQVFDGVSTSNNPTTLNATFTLPAGAELGTHRMRIGTADSGQSTPNPCYSGFWGVTIDIDVTVEEPACQPATIGATTVQDDCNPTNPVYYVNVDVQQGADAVSIEANGTGVNANFPIVSTGNNQVGPFPSGVEVNLVVVHSDPDCNINLGDFVFNCPPINDVCSRAIAVDCGSIESDSTEFANSESLSSCGGFSLDTAPGVWYTMVGTGGDIIVDLSGSLYDTKLGVFSGSCSGLVCVDGDDDGGTGVDSRIQFSSVAGTTYYFYVTGFGSSRGTYTLSIDCVCDAYIEEGECVKLFTGYEPTSSVELTAVGQFGLAPYTYEWSDGQTGATVTVAPTSQTDYMVTVTDSAGCTSTATTTVLVQDISCQDNGNDNNAKVNVCHDGEPLCVSTNAVQAHLNHGDVLGACDDAVDCNTAPLCDARLKVPGPFATDVSTSIEISWGAATGYVTGYYLSVGTTDGGTDILDNEDVGYTLDYSLDGLLDFNTTYYVTIVPYNNIGVGEACESSSFTTESGPWCNAIPVTCGSSTDGNTNDGEVNGYLTACGGSSFVSINDQPGLWYSFQGDGNEVLVSLCGTNFDTILGVYQGDCSSITCVDVDDDGCPFGGSGSSLASETTIQTVVGSTYYIFVTPYSSFSSNQGPFTLNITCLGAPEPNPACEAAESMSCNSTVTGSTVGYSINDLDFCGTSLTSAPGRFYKFEGNGGQATVTTCNPGTDYDTKLGVFSSTDCLVLTCIGGNDDQTGGTDAACVVPETGSSFNRASTVTFDTDLGTTYYVYVTGFAANTGNYELTLTCASPREEATTDVTIAETGDWTLYPNPASNGEVELDLSNYLNQDVSIQMMDFSGKVLVNKEEPNLQTPRYRLSTSGMAYGMYFVRVATPSGVSTKKLMIANN